MSPVFAAGGDYTEAVLRVVQAIPAGRVMTYGDVAWTFGRPGARAVGMVLRYHGSSVAWWRVVRAGGHPPSGLEAESLAHYQAEGTPLVPSATSAAYRVDLARAAWTPELEALSDQEVPSRGIPARDPGADSRTPAPPSRAPVTGATDVSSASSHVLRGTSRRPRSDGDA